jgi:hypothetical protein
MSSGLEKEEVSKHTTSNNTSNIDNELLQDFLGKVMSDLGGAYSAVLVYVGDKLGLYRAMAKSHEGGGAGSMTSEELALKTGTVERCVREWLANQTAGGYIKYDPLTRKYSLPKEHAMVLVDENSTVYSMVVFKPHQRTLERRQRLLKHSAQEKVYHGLIMIQSYIKDQNVSTNQYTLQIYLARGYHLLMVEK